MLKRVLPIFIILGLVLTGCNKAEKNLKSKIEITKLSKDCYVVLNKNEKYDSSIKLSKSNKVVDLYRSQPIDIYLNDKKVVSQLERNEYAIINSIKGLKIKKSSKDIRRNDVDTSIDMSQSDGYVKYGLYSKNKPMKKGIVCSVALDKNKKVIEAKQATFENKEVFETKLSYKNYRIDDFKNTIMIYK